MKMPIILATTAAVAAQREINAQGYDTVGFVAFGLATTEKIHLFVDAGGTWVPLVNEAGASLDLTATAPFQLVEGYGRYGVTKDATAGNAGLDIELRQSGSV